MKTGTSVPKRGEAWRLGGLPALPTGSPETKSGRGPEVGPGGSSAAEMLDLWVTVVQPPYAVMGKAGVIGKIKVTGLVR